MRREADHLSDTAERCRVLAEYFDAKADRRHSAIRGESGDRLEGQYRGLAEKFRAQADHFDSQAEQLYDGANAFEVQKWTVIGFAVILAWTLLHAAIMFGAGGAIEAYVATMRTRTALGIASRKLLEYFAGMSARAAAQRGTFVLAGKAAAIGAVQGGGINLAVQWKQVTHDQRDEVNWKEARIAAIAGGAGGAAGAVAGKWVGDRWVTPATLARAELATTTGQRVMIQLGGALLTGGAGGLVGGLFGTGVAIGLSGEKFTVEGFTESLLPAVAGGFLGAAGHSVASLRAAAPPAVSHGSVPESGDIHGGVTPSRPESGDPAGSVGRPLSEALDAYGPLPAVDANTQPKSQQQKLNELLSALLRDPTTRQNNSVDWQPKNIVPPDNVSAAKSDALAPYAGSVPVSNGRSVDAGARLAQAMEPSAGSEPARVVGDLGPQPVGELHARLLQRLGEGESLDQPMAGKPDRSAAAVGANADELSGVRAHFAEGPGPKPDKPIGSMAAETNTTGGRDVGGTVLSPDGGSARMSTGGEEALVAVGKPAETPENSAAPKPEIATARLPADGEDAPVAAGKSAESSEGAVAPRRSEFDGAVIPERAGAAVKTSAAGAEPAVSARNVAETMPAKAPEDTKPPPNRAEPVGKPSAYPDKPVSADVSGAPPVRRPEPSSGDIETGVAAKVAEDSVAKPPAAVDESGRPAAEEGGTPKTDTDTADDPAAGSRVPPESESAGARHESDSGASAPGQDPGPDAAELAARYRAEAAVI
ncbi:hypothetical protein, partial [Nocardia jinanensis]|uniref:hypothetical protein n=1 Tax=Nocardia jinanensis TaxID=382504 RepID=UPI0016699EC7